MNKRSEAFVAGEYSIFKRFITYGWIFLVVGLIAGAGLFISQAQHGQVQTIHSQGSTLISSSLVQKQATILPKPDHVVIVMEENHSYADILGSASAPYINALASQGASFTDSHAITHPSEPNYLALFSGSTHVFKF